MMYAALVLILLLSWNVFGQLSSQRTIFETAITAARNGDHFNALSGFRKALTKAKIEGESDEFLSRIHFNIGVCLFQLERAEEAVPEFNEAIRLNASYERVYYSLGMAELHVGNLGRAESAFLDSIRRAPDNGEAWFDLAFVYVAKRDYDAAKTAFENAVKYETIDLAIGHNNIGVLVAIKGDIDEAEKRFDLAIKASGGKLAEANNNLAVCRTMRYDHSKLLAKFEFAKGETNE